MDPDQVEIIMNECCDEEDEDGCISYESRFKIKILKRLEPSCCKWQKSPNQETGFRE